MRALIDKSNGQHAVLLSEAGQARTVWNFADRSNIDEDTGNLRGINCASTYMAKDFDSRYGPGDDSLLPELSRHIGYIHRQYEV